VFLAFAYSIANTVFFVSASLSISLSLSSLLENRYDTKDGCEDLTWFVHKVIATIETCRKNGGKTLLHCIQGVSRSCGLAAAYWMWAFGTSYREAFGAVKQRRPVNLNKEGRKRVD